MKESKKFEIGDILYCAITPEGSPNPNIKQGQMGVVVPILRKSSVGTGTALGICVICEKTKEPTKKTYCLWEDDESCYKKMGHIDMEDVTLEYTIHKEAKRIRGEYERCISRVSQFVKSWGNARSGRR